MGTPIPGHRPRPRIRYRPERGQDLCTRKNSGKGNCQNKETPDSTEGACVCLVTLDQSVQEKLCGRPAGLFEYSPAVCWRYWPPLMTARRSPCATATCITTDHRDGLAQNAFGTFTQHFIGSAHNAFRQIRPGAQTTSGTKTSTVQCIGRRCRRDHDRGRRSICRSSPTSTRADELCADEPDTTEASKR